MFSVDIAKMKRRNQLRDVDHLLAHRLLGRDVFLTDDQEILRRAGQLAACGIKVMSPGAFLASGS